MNTFSIVGSVTYVGMLLFLSLLTEDAKLLLTPWSQHHPSSCHPPASTEAICGRREERPQAVGTRVAQGQPRGSSGSWFLSCSRSSKR